jgi:hypothetical protein
MTFYLSGREIAKRGSLDVSKHSFTVGEMEQAGFIGMQTMDGALTGPAVNSGAFNRDFLAHQMAGVIRVATAKRTLDEITGVVTAGNWYDADIVWDVEALTGKAELYGDTSNTPLASFSMDEERRGIVSFELGLLVGKKEEARMSARGVNSTERKRMAVQEALEQAREEVGYIGMASTDTRVFGLLNDPNLPNYVGVSAPWTTFAIVTKDLADMFGALADGSGGRIVEDTSMTLVIAAAKRAVMSYPNTDGMGETVKQWLDNNYPNARVMFTNRFNAANGSANVAYLYADNVDLDESAATATILQIVPAKYIAIGSEQRAKGFMEVSANATAGVFVAYPWAVTRKTGI